ncbi:acetoacetate--CoA ligase [Caenimonas sedimenti]|uniref:Acetoacetate--CoA ligase n=1 Tax=Caenimonas sedimenti TaxID=2596921 RepID=A0A562ZS10_9BURK|nr:acetoacetate--CoA ligase [Caenimonas sedimenti]TWO71323.1 acetoacetate--CoA ligase [Caenimonas sedimenti]
MNPLDTAEVIWRPSAQRVERARITDFGRWLKDRKGLDFPDYTALWQWSVDELEASWAAMVEYLDIPLQGERTPVLVDRSMPGARWFPNTRTNYVSQIFKHASAARPAIVFRSEAGARDEVSWARLERDVAALAQWLRELGVQPGDRVVAYLPNIPQAVVAFLAVASVGAVWSLCSPEMGVAAVVDRFRQIEPKVMIAVDGYWWSGKAHDRRDVLTAMLGELPSVERLVLVPYLDPAADASAWRQGVAWRDTLRREVPLQIDLQPFDQPLWVVYSSGTTGLPKPIVHGHGGILVEHVKTMALHNDVAAGDRFHWYTTTGWVMWNLNVAALLVGATMCVYDGNPAWPDYSTLWRFCGEMNLDFFGAGAAFFTMCEKSGIEPRKVAALGRLRTIGSTGSPLSPESYRWVYDKVMRDVWLTPMSGGTDFAGAFVAGVPTLPVVVGEMQVRCLGANVQAWDDAGRPLVDEVGELVCTAPIPSMPLYLWNDPGGKRLHESYFDVYPGVWRHGDWLRITPRGGAIIYGRSDATINRHGVRMGTSELYRVVEALPEVMDSLVVDLEFLGRESWMPLFVVLRPGHELDAALTARIKSAIRGALSARHVPNDVIAVPEVPRTLTGKKLEVPVKKLLLGQPADKVAHRDAMANPDSLDWFVALARQRDQPADHH